MSALIRPVTLSQHRYASTESAHPPADLAVRTLFGVERCFHICFCRLFRSFLQTLVPIILPRLNPKAPPGSLGTSAPHTLHDRVCRTRAWSLQSPVHLGPHLCLASLAREQSPANRRSSFCTNHQITSQTWPTTRDKASQGGVGKGGRRESQAPAGPVRGEGRYPWRPGRAGRERGRGPPPDQLG